MLTNGDKLVVTKKVASFLDVGDIAKVIDVSEDGMISFAFGVDFMHKGVMTNSEFENHFEKVVEKVVPAITAEYIDCIIDNSDIKAYTVFDKCTVVTCQLPNGFVIVESSACVSPENYDEEMGMSICMDKIINKVWELEGYRLQEELYRENADSVESKCDECAYDCNRCNYENSPCIADCIFPVNSDIEYDEDDEEDDCLDTDLDCDDCDDFDCPFNSNPNR